MIPASAYVAPSAVLCGAVTLGERARVLHGAVLTAEDGEIPIGDDVVIMENALVRGRSRHPVSAGQRGAHRSACPPQWSHSRGRGVHRDRGIAVPWVDRVQRIGTSGQQRAACQPADA